MCLNAMRLSTKFFLLLASSLCLSICQANTTQVQAKAWPSKMQIMLNDVMGLLPYVYSVKNFYNQNNDMLIKSKIHNFAKHVHAITPAAAQKLMGSDPIVGYSLDHLGSDISRAAQCYDDGNKLFARNLLRETLSNCFSCHSATQLGPEFKLPENKFAGIKLEPPEQADLYVATRQYDKALSILVQAFNKPGSFYDNPYVYEMGLQKYLALAVRVKNDPKSAIQLIRQFRKNKDIPFYLQQNTQQWEESLRNWQTSTSPRQSALSQAEAIMTEAERLGRIYGDQAGNIEYLRATALLHGSLKDSKAVDQRAKTYWLLGQSYEALPDLGLWNLPDLYYESCIKVQPGSELAKKCYGDLERVVVAGFSGSGGVFLTQEERKRLSDLRKQAGY
jgi:hypothetical protein